MSARCATLFYDICSGRSSPFDGRSNNTTLHLERVE